MAEKHTKLYGICSNKCAVPIYSAEDIDKRFGGIKSIQIIEEEDYEALKKTNQIDHETLYLIKA